ncbi:MAG: glycosyltransferase [bacterium]
MKNSVIVVSIGRDEHLNISLPTIENYCNKFDINLEIIKKSKWNFKKKNGYNYMTFEKNQVYNFYEKYDKILRLDSDIIITPNCPNLFELDDNNIYGVYEDVGSRKNNRRNQIKLVKKSCGDILDWNSGYINSGVVLASKKHKEIYNINDKIEKIYDINLGDFKEQTLLNWKIRNYGYNIVNLGYKYNHMSMFEKTHDLSYIIHFAGPQNGKVDKMKNVYKKFYKV